MQLEAKMIQRIESQRAVTGSERERWKSKNKVDRSENLEREREKKVAQKKNEKKIEQQSDPCTYGSLNANKTTKTKTHHAQLSEK